MWPESILATAITNASWESLYKPVPTAEHIAPPRPPNSFTATFSTGMPSTSAKTKHHHLDVHCPHLAYAWQIRGLVRRHQLCHKSSLNLFPTMIAAKRTPTWPQSQNLHIEKTRRMIRAVIRNRNIILFLSCNNNHCYVAEAYDYRPSKRFPESLPSC